MSPWSAIAQRMAGKWQIPLFVVSLLLLATAVWRIVPAPDKLPVEDAVSYLDSLLDARDFGRAVELAYVVTERAEIPEREKASVYLRLARAEYGLADREGTRSADAGDRVTQHYADATIFGLSLESDDLRRLAFAHEWAGRYVKAYDSLTAALDAGAKPAGDLRRHLIELMTMRLTVPPMLVNDQIETLLTELEPHRLDLLLWALEEKMYVLTELGQPQTMANELAKYKEAFVGSDFEPNLGYLEALLQYRTGHFDDAEAQLRTIRNGIARDDPLYAKTGWLLGQTVLGDPTPQRPMEAMSFFSDVIENHPHGEYAVASRLGMAEAYGYLQRHDEAIGLYRIAIKELSKLNRPRAINLPVIRTSLAVLAEARRQAGDISAAVDYARLATSILDRADLEQTNLYLKSLANLLVTYADQLDERSDTAIDDKASVRGARNQAARDAYAEAGETYVELTRLNVLNERLGASSAWQASSLFARAGKFTRSVDLFETFIAERPDHALVARALLRIGQIQQSQGHWPEAVASYQKCYRRFPRSLDGLRALVPLAQAYLSMGPGKEKLAEKTLRIVLDDSDVFTPQAPEYADAMFLLADVLNREGEYENAIATLDEVLTRYASDPRATRAKYMLADSYRQSGLALKKEMSDVDFSGELEQIRTDAYARFREARRLYRQLIEDYEVKPFDTMTALERMYQRHAYVYEADSFFEMQEFRTALELYEEAAGAYKDQPTALAAYVQIINCHVFLGDTEEARAALARALILVDTMPDQAFTESVSPEGRDDWKRYFEWLGESKLF